MDKLVADGRRVTISNDGATIMRLLEIEHPAAKTLVDISMSQVRFIYLQQLLSFFCSTSVLLK
jgi:chaperonin GroEL (HSP60 family)